MKCYLGNERKGKEKNIIIIRHSTQLRLRGEEKKKYKIEKRRFLVGKMLYFYPSFAQFEVYLCSGSNTKLFRNETQSSFSRRKNEKKEGIEAHEALFFRIILHSAIYFYDTTIARRDFCAQMRSPPLNSRR
jgi:hypothetical protein